MNFLYINLFVFICFLSVQLFVLYFCFKIIKKERLNRDKYFSVLDEERWKVSEIQKNVSRDIEAAKKVTSDCKNAIKVIATEAEIEWKVFSKKAINLSKEIFEKSEINLEKNLEKLNAQIMAWEKKFQDLDNINEKIENNMEKAQKIIRMLDVNIAPEELIKDMQAHRYEQAKESLLKGEDASVIAKRLGMTMSEVFLISSLISHHI